MVFEGLTLMAFSKSKTVKQQPAGADRCLFGIMHWCVKSSDFAPSCASPNIAKAILGEVGGGCFATIQVSIQSFRVVKEL
jgi:hypothetical protein